MLPFLIFLCLLMIFIILFTRQKQFGKIPSGSRLARIQQSPNFKEGKFRNVSPTPELAEGVTYYQVMKEFFFRDKTRSKPKDILPSVKTDLHKLSPNSNTLVWFGHSSYLMQVDGKKILVDPVLSGSASPVSFTTKAFKGTDPYSANDIPEIDFLFITHDHWDHLDYKTILQLKPKIKMIITGLGTGAHLEHWGFDKNRIHEMDWNESVNLGNGFEAFSVTARHFSGRGFKRNRSIWLSFVLRTPTMKIFIGGDSGYDSHFEDIGKKFGNFDLAILENGQYNKNWKYIHMMPEEVLMVAKHLNAKRILPVHSAKFSLSTHDWDTPLKTITELNKEHQLPLLTPVIGEAINLNSDTKSFSFWWEGIN